MADSDPPPRMPTAGPTLAKFVTRPASTLLLLFLLALPLPGQMPAVGIIDYYGLHHVSRERVRRALQIKEGDRLPDSPAGAQRRLAAQRRLESIPGVLHARLSATCCASGKTILFVGIEEKGSPVPRWRKAPQATVRLPAEIVTAGQDFAKAWTDAVLKGDTLEDDSQGHALMHDPALRAVQERFLVYAARDLGNLRDVLRNSGDAEQGALAAEVLGYAPDKRAIVPDLEAAMSDADANVRNNAMRALGVIASFAQENPALGIAIHGRPFISLLNSLVWTDRNKASLALTSLTESRDPALLADLRGHALPALTEMARWKSAGHAQPAFLILGRIASLSEKEIMAAWERGDRESVITAATRPRPGS